MSVSAAPPRWAEVLLRGFLTPGDFENVSGDLLEEYRESVYPARGSLRADMWYVTQVLGFAWRDAFLWATLSAIAFITRTAMDWLVPTVDFQARAAATTVLGAGILVLAGFWTAQRSGSFAAGTIIGVAITVIAAAIDTVGSVALLSVWHDSKTIAAIRGSGGLEEVFTLPVLMVLPGILLCTIGGLFGAVAYRLRSL
jgi:hypothetical protein